MTTQTRVFTVEVTGCKDCPNRLGHQCVEASMPQDHVLRKCIYHQNKNGIVRTCPMYQHSFVKDEKK